MIYLQMLSVEGSQAVTTKFNKLKPLSSLQVEGQAQGGLPQSPNMGQGFSNSPNSCQRRNNPSRLLPAASSPQATRSCVGRVPAFLRLLGGVQQWQVVGFCQEEARHGCQDEGQADHQRQQPWTVATRDADQG